LIAFYENRKDDFYAAFSPSPKRNRLQCAAHLHHHIELVLLLEGDSVAYAGTERYPLTGGDAFIAFPNQIHRFETTGPEKYYIFIVSPDLAPELAATFMSTTPRSPRIAGAADDPELLEIAARLLACKNEEHAYSDVIRRGYLQVMFAKLLQKSEIVESAHHDSHSLKTIIAYCTQNYQNELSLSVLEQELHINKYYISHLFADKLNISFSDYINSLRVSYACHHLRHSNHSITEIVELVGFGTPRTFNRAFLKHIGCTPSEYRQGKRPKNGDPARK